MSKFLVVSLRACNGVFMIILVLIYCNIEIFFFPTAATTYSVLFQTISNIAFLWFLPSYFSKLNAWEKYIFLPEPYFDN